MIFARKENRLREICVDHFSSVREALLAFSELLDSYLVQAKPSPGLLSRLHAAEGRADERRDEILTLLHGGAFMPTNREDYVVLVALVDGIANQAQSTGNLLVLTLPPVPDFLRQGLRDLCRGAVNIFDVLTSVFSCLNADISRVADRAREVSRLESESDRLEWDLIREITDSDCDRALKRDLREIVQDIGKLADLTEDAASRLKLMLIKQSF